MKFILGMLSLSMVTSFTFPAFSIDRDVEIEIRRLEQQLTRTNSTNRQLLKDIRALQRAIDKIKKLTPNLEAKVDDLTDTVIKMQNIDLANLKAGQKNLYDQIPILNWGEDERSCKSIGSKHQQIKTVLRDDGKVTLRSLCFDGKVLHLSSELNIAP